MATYFYGCLRICRGDYFVTARSLKRPECKDLKFKSGAAMFNDFACDV